MKFRSAPKYCGTWRPSVPGLLNPPLFNSDWENGPYSSTLLSVEIGGFGWKNC